MDSPTHVPEPGAIAYVRQRTYLVEETTPAGAHDTCSRVRLACLDDDAQGQPLEVLWELEPDARIVESEDWAHLGERGFDPVERFAAYYNVLRWNCVTAADPGLCQAPFRAGIRLDEYQLEPLRMALRLPRVNLFIADDVGLGKTIEAGLIMRELLLRQRIHTIVVACPPVMLEQWQEEMQERFGLGFEMLDRAYVQRMRQERGFGVNPWSTHSRLLVSHRLLADEAYAGPLRARLGGLQPGSLLVLDEAHHAAPASGARYAIDSHFTRAIDDLAPRFEHRLFLSATPHNGHSNSFARLLQMLDRQRFWPGMKVRESQLRPIMVRRLKEDLREVNGGFAERVVEAVEIAGLPPEAPELRLSRLLDRYRELQAHRLAGETKRRQASAALMICGLQKRLLSSVEAFAKTLRAHVRTLERNGAAATRAAAPAARLFARSLDPNDDEATLTPAEMESEVEREIEGLTADIGGRPQEEEQTLLREMTAAAEVARNLPDARIEALAAWIREHCCPGGIWNGIRLLIFTEFEDTLRYLRQQLAMQLAELDVDERFDTFSGHTSRPDREKIKTAFNAEPEAHPLRILLATDAAREGLNLQAHCWNLFHFDLPWNPSRIEQRNGRIDRKLQPEPKVYCRYFRYAQRPEDPVLEALVVKTQTIRAELGSAADVLGDKVERLLQGGIRHAEVAELREAVTASGFDAGQDAAMREELEAVRERQDALRQQIERARTLLSASKKALGFRRERLEAAVGAGLTMLSSEALRPGTEDACEGAYTFPALDQRAGADPTWADTLDSLRPPRAHDETLAEWRRHALRPVVFTDPGVLTERVVQLHLEQPVVRRLLGRFLAQGFIYHDLSRACLSLTSDAVPRVVLLGRLALYGAGASRLHEEILAVAARWIDPAIRKAGLQPYGRTGETEALRELEAGLERAGAKALAAMAAIPGRRRAELQAAAPGDIAALLPHLEARGQDLALAAEAKLKERAAHEAAEMVRLLEEQRQAITQREGRFDTDSRQLVLGFDDAAKRQLESERRGWRRRLEQIPGEIESEPERIRAGYAVALTRIEPLGLVYLWPEGA